MLNTIFEEEELLDKMNENDDGDDLNKNQSDELIMTDERLDIERQWIWDHGSLLIILHF